MCNASFTSLILGRSVTLVERIFGGAVETCVRDVHHEGGLGTLWHLHVINLWVKLSLGFDHVILCGQEAILVLVLLELRLLKLPVVIKISADRSYLRIEAFNSVRT